MSPVTVVWVVLLVGAIPVDCKNGVSNLTIYEPKEVTELLNGFDYHPEGLAFDGRGNFYVSSSMTDGPDGHPIGAMYKVDLAKKKFKLLISPVIDGVVAFPLGFECDQEGNLWVTDGRLGLIKILNDGSSFKQVSTHDSDNKPLQGLHDLTFDLTGNLWISGPFPEIAPTPWDMDLAGLANLTDGAIYCFRPDIEVMVKLDSGFNFPNGMAVQHDKDGNPTTLIVVLTFSNTIWAYDITGPCQVTNKRVWGQAPVLSDNWGGPDGVVMDSKGNVLVSYFGVRLIYVFGPEGGDPIKAIKIPFATATNLEFKPGERTLYVTDYEHKVWSLDWQHKGMELYGQVTRGAV